MNVQSFVTKNIFFISILILHALIQLALIQFMPVVNDEAFYLYDGFNINQGLIPFHDFTTKSGPFIYLIAFWQSIFGYNIFLSRLLMIFLTSGILISLYLLLHNYDKKIALVSVLILALDFYFTANSLLVMTNTPFILGYLITILLLEKSLQKKSFLLIVLTSIALTVTFYIRQVAVFLLPLIIIIPFLQYFIIHKKKSLLKRHLQTVLWVIFIFISISGGIYFLSLQSLGTFKADQLLGTNSVSLTAKIYNEPTVFELMQSKLTIISDAFTKFLLRSPFLFISIITVLLSFAGFIKDIFYLLLVQTTGSVSIAITIFLKYIDYVKKYYGGNPIPYTILFTGIIAMNMTYLVNSLFVLKNTKKLLIEKTILYLLLLTTITSAGIISVYILYSKFEVVYEIYPMLVIPASIVLIKVWQKSTFLITKFFAIGFILLSSLFSLYLNVTFPASGSHNLSEITDAASLIQLKSDPEDTVFTGFTAFAVASERRVPFNISHPTWYGYKHIPESYRNIFLPDIEVYTNELIINPPQFAVIDRYTKQTFLDSYPKISKFVSENYRVEKKYSTFDLLVLKSIDSFENE